MALENIGVQWKSKFRCDNDADVILTMKANFQSEIIYVDLTQRDNRKAPQVDIYIAGFPCQPFSSAGKQQGFNDEKGRGNLFTHILDYLSSQRPKVFILENVVGFDAQKFLEWLNYQQLLQDLSRSLLLRLYYYKNFVLRLSFKVIIVFF